MPTYAYECSACGHRFEEFQSMTAAPLRKCPTCNKSRLQRLIGAGAGVIFKGSGFYETDYKRANSSKSSDGDSSGKSSDSSKSDASSSASKGGKTTSKKD